MEIVSLFLLVYVMGFILAPSVVSSTLETNYVKFFQSDYQFAKVDDAQYISISTISNLQSEIQQQKLDPNYYINDKQAREKDFLLDIFNIINDRNILIEGILGLSPDVSRFLNKFSESGDIYRIYILSLFLISYNNKDDLFIKRVYNLNDIAKFALQGKLATNKQIDYLLNLGIQLSNYSYNEHMKQSFQLLKKMLKVSQNKNAYYKYKFFNSRRKNNKYFDALIQKLETDIDEESMSILSNYYVY